MGAAPPIGLSPGVSRAGELPSAVWQRVWFPKNLARNFPVNLSGFELWSLQFQGLLGQSKTDPVKLCATL